jgi:accessory gene regulator B
MVKIISKTLAVELGNRLQSTKEDMDVYSYGLEIVLCSLIKIILILGSAYLLGILNITLFYLMSFILLRHFGGGVHLSTYKRCLAVGLISTIFCAKFVDGLWLEPNIILWVTIILLILGALCILKWVPAGTSKKMINDSVQRLKQKIKTSLVLTLILGIIGILYINKYYYYAFSMALGGFVSFFLMSPIGYKTIYAIEIFINNIK